MEDIGMEGSAKSLSFSIPIISHTVNNEDLLAKPPSILPQVTYLDQRLKPVLLFVCSIQIYAF
jgi:hypothetical protein